MSFQKYLKENTTMKVINELNGARTLGFKGKDDMGKFWVVTKASKNSELGDILFDADVFDMILQARGGLAGGDIELITHDKNKAKKLAETLLKGVQS